MMLCSRMTTWQRAATRSEQKIGKTTSCDVVKNGLLRHEDMEIKIETT